MYSAFETAKPENILKKYNESEHPTVKKKIKKAASAVINIPTIEKAYIGIRSRLDRNYKYKK